MRGDWDEGTRIRELHSVFLVASRSHREACWKRHRLMEGGACAVEVATATVEVFKAWGEVQRTAAARRVEMRRLYNAGLSHIVNDWLNSLSKYSKYG